MLSGHGFLLIADITTIYSQGYRARGFVECPLQKRSVDFMMKLDEQISTLCLVGINFQYDIVRLFSA